MKLNIITALSVALLAGFVSLSSGCASSGGPYFQNTREHRPHTQRNRIHNPADYRYVKAEDVPQAD